MDRRGTGRCPGRLVPGIPAATVQCVLSQTGRSRELVCLSVSVASCEAYIGGRGYGSPHTGLSLFSASRDTFLERLRTGPGVQHLLGTLRSRYLSTWGLRSVVLLGVEWLHKRRHKSAGSTIQHQDHRAVASLNIAGRFHRDRCLLRCSFPFPSFLVQGEPSQNSGLGEETPEAPGRMPAAKPIHPSEDALPMCGQNSSPRGATSVSQTSPIIGMIER